ncbi:hypothetical protein DY000_02052456 [Brassica cretica]|uniref:Uncharacterized protein n=1 Tax=Brassica cretica TaxID=69181 RepID=A0ABQ7ABW3_BRACR|nr:hypothetical protein DY000_02052456 [Brassica cretica]
MKSVSMRIQKQTQRRTFLRPDRSLCSELRSDRSLHSEWKQAKKSPTCFRRRYVVSEGLTGGYVASGSKPRRVLLVFAVKSQRKLRLRRNKMRFDEDSNENVKEDLSEALQRPSCMRARSLRSDRVVCVLGRYVATELYIDSVVTDFDPNKYHGLAMEEAGVLHISHETVGETSIDGNNMISIDTHHGTELDARTEESTSIDRRGQPSIDGHCEFGQRSFDSSSNKIFQWEDIIDILERATMHVYAHICLPEHAEKFTRTFPQLGSYRRADIDDSVHVIYRIQDMSQNDTYKRIDDVYYPLNDIIDMLTTRMDELKKEMNVIQRQNAVQPEASIDGYTRLSIDDRHTSLQRRLITVKLLEDKLDEINFFQDLMREDFS